MKVKMIPPKKLFHPVLPYRVKRKNERKLLFPLCRTCAEQSNYWLNSCRATNVVGSGPTMEVYEAMRSGYRLDKIYEVWHWRVSTTTLFKSYVDMFFRIKEEASGWPRPDLTERQKDDYIDAFERENDVRLRKDHIEDNPTRRKIAKLILNSLWGGFVKNPYKKRVKDILMNQNEFATWINKD